MCFFYGLKSLKSIKQIHYFQAHLYRKRNYSNDLRRTSPSCFHIRWNICLLEVLRTFRKYYHKNKDKKTAVQRIWILNLCIYERKFLRLNPVRGRVAGDPSGRYL